MSNFSNHSCQADLFVPCIKIKRLTTASFKGLIQSFGAVKAPTNVYSIDAERGGRLELEAVNTMNMLRLLQIVLICVSKQVVEEAMPHASEEVWSYLDPQDRRRGPFSALKLHKWLKNGHLHRDFLCQHGPSRVWIPIWLLCTHYDSAAVASGALGGTTQNLLGEAVPMKRAVTLEHQKDPDSDVEMEDVAVQVLELRNDQVFSQALCTAADMDVDEESIPKPSVSLPDPAVHVAYYPESRVVPLPGGVIRHQSRWTATSAAGYASSSRTSAAGYASSSRTSAAGYASSSRTSAAGHASSSRTSAAGHASSSRTTIPSTGSAADDAGTVATPGRRQVVTAASPSSSVVEVITKGEAGIDLVAALSMLASVDTGDKGCQSRSLLSASEVIMPQLPSLGDGSRGEAAAAAGSWRLYLVLDTNLLLMSRSTLRLVEQIRLNYGPQSTASRAAAGDAEYQSDGSSSVGVVVGSLQAERAPFGHHHHHQQQRLLEVVVLVPWVVLQELDGLKGRGDGTGEVASMARAAIKVLRAGLDDNGRFFQGQSLQEYRDASQLYSDPLGGIISADDRILYCCLHFQDMLGCRVVNHKQNHSLGQQKHQKHLEGRKCRLVLLTNDNNLRNKADFSSVRCFDGSSIPLSSDPSLLLPYLLQLLGLSKQQLQQLQSMKAHHSGTAITAVQHAVQRHSPAAGVTPATSSSTGSCVGIEASLGSTVQQLVQQQYAGCHVVVRISHDGMDVDETVLDDSRAAAGEAPLQTQPSSSHHQYSTT
ncbi:hypothetical protein CEUSTIGMA_g12837.t1 [Chlamydomonas eustigma]|uniref:GYF domain-containing protein n=1 Tax=Chlamydomonas eustigma TaxID=1157962 RepID=A0A250XQR5_9CHLO|nr:hypothetical protein CEUSTIGMA_g12837.t1 [Chlamydomonas eustigma]|eukprot:GAX85421.1 hypothetical protein CEUSTIGMA_g12837.t1 [Chlamydomonas eustigma]